MLWAAACMYFFGILQVGEGVAPGISKFDSSTNLCAGDVKVHNRTNPQYLEVRIKASKTNPFRQGVLVYLGVTHSSLCPVAAILHYVVICGPSPGPFFVFSDGTYLTRDWFVAAVRKALDLVSIDSSSYAGHSFRIDVATIVAKHGIHPRFRNQDPGTLEELSLLHIHPYSKGLSLLGVKDSGRSLMMPPAALLQTLIIQHL